MLFAKLNALRPSACAAGFDPAIVSSYFFANDSASTPREASKLVPLAGIDVHQRDKRRAEEHGIDPIEVVVVALENSLNGRP